MKTITMTCLALATLLLSSVAHADDHALGVRADVGNGPGGLMSLSGSADLSRWATAELSVGLHWVSYQIGAGLRLTPPTESRHHVYVEPSYAFNLSSPAHLVAGIAGYQLDITNRLSLHVGIGAQYVVAGPDRSNGDDLSGVIDDAFTPHFAGDIRPAGRLGLELAF